MKYIFTAQLKERLSDTLRQLRKAPQRRAVEYMQTVLLYLRRGTKKLQDSEVEEALEEAFPEEGGVMYEFLERWKKQGLE